MSIKVPDSLNAQIYLNQKRAIGAPPVGQTPVGPSIVTRPVINGLPYDGETLTLTTQPVWDGTELTSGWVWQVSGVDQPGTIGATTFDVTGLIAAGSLIQVRAYASNAEGDRSALSNALRVIDRPVPPSPPTSNMWTVELA